jgi:hypothetical protein
LTLATFFTVIPKDPVQVTPADVFEFLADQRADRSVIRVADRESGLSAQQRTVEGEALSSSSPGGLL